MQRPQKGCKRMQGGWLENSIFPSQNDLFSFVGLLNDSPRPSLYKIVKKGNGYDVMLTIAKMNSNGSCTNNRVKQMIGKRKW